MKTKVIPRCPSAADTREFTREHNRPPLVGRLLALALFIIVAASTSRLLFAQGYFGSNPGGMSSNPMIYDPKQRPPLPLPEAYGLALVRLGEKTNTSYCLTASCLERTNSGWAGWTFVFSNTNSERTPIVVFYDKHTWVDPRGN